MPCDRVIAINLIGVFNGISAVGRSFREARRGHVVNTASLSGMVMDGPGMGSYGPSKAGVFAMSEVPRLEMEPYGQHGEGGRDNSASLPGAEMRPAQAGDPVLRGIKENRPEIYIHSERLAAVEKRFAGIMSGFDAA
jgi:NAD(P)-dependent dehydrogenase (short-subunit alcohol dehydrogenase family)